MNVKEKIAVLEKESRSHLNEIFRIRNEIKRLQFACPHENVNKGRGIKEDSEEDILWRRIDCLDCGYNWVEYKSDLLSNGQWPYDLKKAGNSK